MYYKIIFILILLFLQGSIYSQNGSPKVLSLEQAIDLALESNESILIAGNDVKRANSQIRQAWAGALPDISFQGLYTRNFKQQVIFFPDIFGGNPNELIPVPITSKNAYSFSINVEQPLFESGKVIGGIKAANLFKKFSSEGFAAARADLILATKQTYYTVLLSKRLLDINRQSLEQQYANLLNTRRLFEQGQVSELDTLSAWVDYTNIQPRIISTENELRTAENRLKNLVGLNLNEEIKLDGELAFVPSPHSNLESLQNEALSRRPELRQLEFQANILQANIGIARADHFPKLSLLGSYQSVAQSNSFDFGEGLQSSLSGSIRLEVPIFKGFATSAKVQEATLDYENALHQIQLFKDELDIQIKSIYLNIQEAEKRVQVQQHAIKQAERALFIAQRRYNEGVGTDLERSNALLALNVTKTNYAQAVYDHKIALAQLDKAIGRQ